MTSDHNDSDRCKNWNRKKDDQPGSAAGESSDKNIACHSDPPAEKRQISGDYSNAASNICEFYQNQLIMLVYHHKSPLQSCSLNY